MLYLLTDYLFVMKKQKAMIRRLTKDDTSFSKQLVMSNIECRI